MENKLPVVRRTAHAVVEVPISAVKGMALPLLILEDGEISLYAASYIRTRHLEGVKSATLTKSVKAIGLLYDYYVLGKGSPVLDGHGTQQLFKQFFEARRYGFEALGWNPVKLSTAKNDLNYVSDFSQYCADNFSHIAANPIETRIVNPLSGRDFQEMQAKDAARKRYDLLYHVYGATQEGKGIFRRRTFQPESGQTHKSTTVKYFPPEKVLEFISSAPSIRERLCWILIFWGGLRISELLHIYLRDVSLDTKDGTARVVLAHPVDGAIEWINHSGVKRRGTRSAFLKERYGRIPRNLLSTKHPERAGWKGMLYQDGKSMENTIYWTNPDIGRLFWRLHQIYLRTERLQAPDEHPYYFISLRGESYGQPLKLSNLNKQFYENASRVGLTPSMDGVNPHGGRHFYGYFSATWLRLSKEIVQEMMHHRSIISTEVYYKLDKAAVRDDLMKAHGNLMEHLPNFMKTSTLLLSGENNEE